MKGRLTKSQLVAVTADPALSNTVEPSVLSDYMLTRDLSFIPVNPQKHINTLTGEPVAMFRLKPLARKDSVALSDGGSIIESEIVRKHVTEVYNYDGVETDVDKKTGQTCITQSSMNNMDDETIKELSIYLIDAARGADGSAGRPFSLPDGWQAVRMRSRVLPVNIARLEKAASQTQNQPTDQDSESDQK
jgi:hypothetical protein